MCIIRIPRSFQVRQKDRGWRTRRKKKKKRWQKWQIGVGKREKASRCSCMISLIIEQSVFNFWLCYFCKYLNSITSALVYKKSWNHCWKMGILKQISSYGWQSTVKCERNPETSKCIAGVTLSLSIVTSRNSRVYSIIPCCHPTQEPKKNVSNVLTA